MKEFFKRLGLEVSVEDFARYIRILIDDLSPILKSDDFKVHLLDQPAQVEDLTEAQRQALDENKVWRAAESGELVLPVVYGGRPLAVLNAALPADLELPEAAYPFLIPIITQSLEKILLYLSLIHI